MYKPYVTCKYLDITYPAAFLVTDSQDISFWLEFASLPDAYKGYITGLIVITGEGDLIAMWLTEYSAPYDHVSIYHPLPFYADKPDSDMINYPVYWKQDNEFYQTI